MTHLLRIKSFTIAAELQAIAMQRVENKVLVVEDESLIAEMLKMMLEELGHKVAVVYHRKKAFDLIEKDQFDFAILDINIEGGMEGIEIARKLNEKKTPFMYLTSYADKTTLDAAMSTIPGAYLIKPFTQDELYAALSVAKLHAPLKGPKTVMVRDGYKTHLLLPEHIHFIKSDNVYVEVHLADKKIVTRTTLSQLMDQLPAGDFVRIHRTYVVNKAKIEALSRNSLQIGGITLPISRVWRDDAHAQFSKTGS